MAKDQTTTTEATETVALPEGATLTARKEVEVSGNPNLDHVTFTSFAVTLEKYSPRAFRAMLNGTEFISLKSEKDLVAQLALHENGDHPLNGGKGDFTVTKSGDWEKVSNEPELDPLTEDQEQRLVELAAEINEAEEARENAVKQTATSVYNIGAAMLEANAMLVRYDENGVAIKASNQAWGKWLTVNMPMRLKGKNAPSEHMQVASMSDALIDCIPEGKASAKAIIGWRDTLRSSIAGIVAEAIMSKLTDKEAPKWKAEGFDFMGQAKVGKVLQERLERFSKDGKEASELGTQYMTKDGQKLIDEKAEAARQDHVTLGAFADWYLEAEEAAQKKIGLRLALKKALGAELSKVPEAEEEKQAADDAAEKYSDADSKVARGFNNFTVDEAARHIAKIVLVRDDWEAVLSKVAGIAEALEAEAQEAENKSEEEDQSEE